MEMGGDPTGYIPDMKQINKLMSDPNTQSELLSKYASQQDAKAKKDKQKKLDSNLQGISKLLPYTIFKGK